MIYSIIHFQICGALTLVFHCQIIHLLLEQSLIYSRSPVNECIEQNKEAVLNFIFAATLCQRFAVVIFFIAETEVYKSTTPSYASRILNCFVHKVLIKQCTRVSSFCNLGVQV